MRYLNLLILLSFLMFACDDGDIITVQLEFDGDLERCDNLVNEYLLYDEINNPAESLSLLMPRNEFTEGIFTSVIAESDSVFQELNGSTWRFLYRTYNASPDLCDLVGDGSIRIVEDNEALDGEVYISTSFEDFDDDGIPSSVEDANLDGDFDPTTNPTDRDGDGIPDYIDQDDDNDNAPTRLELPDPNGDGDVSDAQDTDGDGTPDYLDTDDDNDGILSILEDEQPNGNLFDDFDLESPNPNIPRFQNPDAAVAFTPDELSANNYTREYSTRFVLTGIDLGPVSYERLVFGTYITTVTNPE